MSDSEQCSNRLDLDLIPLLVNFLGEPGQIMTRYDLLRGYTSDSEQCSNGLQLYLIVLVNFSCELGQIMTRYDLLYSARFVILSNV